jgi:hypothetical protein
MNFRLELKEVNNLYVNRTGQLLQLSELHGSYSQSQDQKYGIMLLNNLGVPQYSRAALHP